MCGYDDFNLLYQRKGICGLQQEYFSSVPKVASIDMRQHTSVKFTTRVLNEHVYTRHQLSLDFTIMFLFSIE